MHVTLTLAKLNLPGSSITLRRATRDDLPTIVDLLVEDPLGRTHEAPIQADDLVIATMQLSFIPGLARHGALRAQAEAVRVAANYRSRGLGAAMFHWAIDEARRRGCALVQLTTNKTRTDARRFYERLGFTASHEGFKLNL